MADSCKSTRFLSSLLQEMTWRQIGTKPFLETMLIFDRKFLQFHWKFQQWLLNESIVQHSQIGFRASNFRAILGIFIYIYIYNDTFWAVFGPFYHLKIRPFFNIVCCSALLILRADETTMMKTRVQWMQYPNGFACDDMQRTMLACHVSLGE